MSHLITRRNAGALLAVGGVFAAAGCATASNNTSAAAAPLSNQDHHPRQRVAVLDSEMSYVEVGHGDPIVFLHGNPTWSYLWRNIITRLQGRGRLLAPDLVGMGQSRPAPNGSYRFVDHARYLDAWFEAVGATDNVTLIVHDWGSSLGFHRAARFPQQVKRIAYAEAIVHNRTWAEFGPFEQAFRALRSPAGEQMVLEQNFFIEQVLPHAVLNPLPEEVLNQYRAPFPTPQSRLPTLTWPREIPVEGQPEDVTAIVANYAQWLTASPIPKLYFDVQPGTISPRARAVCESFPNQTKVTVRGVHYVQEDSPEEMSTALLRFLSA